MTADNSGTGFVNIGLPVWTDTWASTANLDTASNDGKYFTSVIKLHRKAAGDA